MAALSGRLSFGLGETRPEKLRQVQVFYVITTRWSTDGAAVVYYRSSCCCCCCCFVVDLFPSVLLLLLLLLSICFCVIFVVAVVVKDMFLFVLSLLLLLMLLICCDRLQTGRRSIKRRSSLSTDSSHLRTDFRLNPAAVFDGNEAK